MKDINQLGMRQEASVVANKGVSTQLGMIDYFHVECFDAEGNFKWKETIKNLVTSEGLNHVLNVAFKSGTQITTWYVGLKDIGTPLASDPAAQLPGGTMQWTEYENYESATRPTLTLGTVSSSPPIDVDNVGNEASFTIDTPAGSVYGVFVVDSAQKGTNSNATVLYGVGDFASAKPVDDADTLNVTVTLVASSA